MRRREFLAATVVYGLAGCGVSSSHSEIVGVDFNRHEQTWLAITLRNTSDVERSFSETVEIDDRKMEWDWSSMPSGAERTVSRPVGDPREVKIRGETYRP